MLTLLLQMVTVQLLTILWLSLTGYRSRLAIHSMAHICPEQEIMTTVPDVEPGATGVSALFQTSSAMLLDLADYI